METESLGRSAAGLVSCDNVPAYTEGTTEQLVTNEGHLYSCKVPGWCQGAAWAYAPGTGMYWTEAWTDDGECDPVGTGGTGGGGTGGTTGGTGGETGGTGGETGGTGGATGGTGGETGGTGGSTGECTAASWQSGTAYTKDDTVSLDGYEYTARWWTMDNPSTANGPDGSGQPWTLPVECNPSTASCTDGVLNGDETDVDCGGSCPTACSLGEACVVNADCETLFCNAGVCDEPTTGTDSDDDGLPDSAETNTSVYVGPNDTGTDPFNPDTDGDGLSDGDEVLGTSAGLDLPAMGTNPLRKDILVEHDWFEDANECAFHSHRPTQGMIDDVTAAFANSPVTNPDGSTGINLINDYGQGGAFTGGNLISDPDGVLDGGVFSTEFQNYKSTHFAANRVGYFHYAIFPHRYNTNSGSSGQAGIKNDNLIVSLYCHYDNRLYVGNTIMHELGHNLNLLHGGGDGVNYKPNYNSVMNYQFQFPGVDDDCDRYGDQVLDYSSGVRPSLDESALLEEAGVCGNVPGSQSIDWNFNGTIDAQSISYEINSDSTLSVLHDHDDWSAIVYDWDNTFGGAGASLFTSAPQAVDCENVPPAP